MHFRKRAPRGFELDLGEQDDSEKIMDIIDERDGEYLCVMEESEDIEWRQVAPTHPLIIKYKKSREELLQVHHDGPREIAESDIADFMSSEWEDV